MNAPLVSARGLSRRYPGVLALDGADLDILPGEIIGLVGKNGAGKSTMIRILAGVEGRDAGELSIGGTPVGASYGPHDAHAAGLAFMHQELANVPDMTVAENVALGSRLPRRAGLLVDWPTLHATVQRVLDRLELRIAPRDRVGDLTVVQQRMVMIARALFHDARVLVLDEPSTSLTESEINQLHSVIRAMANDGRAIVYVSHRLREIVEITSKVVVMQDGRVTLTRPTAGISERDIVEAIAGAPRGNTAKATEARRIAGETLLAVRGLGRPGKVHNVSFEVKTGEILGIAGLVGSGRTELVRLIAGADRASRGAVELEGRPVRLHSPRDAIAAGIVLLPEDRRHEGLVVDMTVRENITLPSLRRYRTAGLPFIQRSSETRLARDMVAQLGVRTPGVEQQVRRLSGGNQQKVVLAKWLARGGRVFIFDEPTQGVDVHAKEEIFRLIRASVSEGCGAIVISSDFSELVSQCDRVVVMREGALIGSLEGPAISEAGIVEMAYAN
ncbi:MAG: sugar ABC transporter ATP-binding protein [Rhizobiaceae bacterium]|nr:sugar ABC transporter ATP-binding protein [Rhizobiaceae bacterium]